MQRNGGMSGDNTSRRGLIILVAILLLLALGVMYFMGVFNRVVRNVRAVKLRCVATQNIQTFGDSLLYYDGDSLVCLSSNGNERWNYMVGSGASFHAGESFVVIWRGSQLSILNRNGRSTYDNNIGEIIQFARAGEKYIAVVHGDDSTSEGSTTVSFYNPEGERQDNETSAYKDMMVLDAGFFANGDYAWTTAMDLYGTVPSTTLNTYRVNSMTTGSADLGETITYKVIYAGNTLNVVSTRQLRRYDYNGTQNTAQTVLVYGWKLIDDVVIDNKAMMLFAPTRQINDMITITELRCLFGNQDKRLTLPGECVGAGIFNRRIYAFSSDSLYRADLNASRFTAVSMPLPNDVTGYLGMLSDGTAIIASGIDVYAVTVP